MLTRIWERIDKFYLIFFLALVPIVILAIFSFKGIFSAYNLAYDVSIEGLDEKIKVDETKLEEAYLFVKDKKPHNLEVKNETPKQ